MSIEAARIAGAPAAPDARAELRKAARQLEGVFLSHLFRAMRETVAEGDPAAAQSGRELFTGLLDDALAEQAAAQLERGMGEALYRQLSRRLPTDAAATTGTIGGSSAGTARAGA